MADLCTEMDEALALLGILVNGSKSIDQARGATCVGKELCRDGTEWKAPLVSIRRIWEHISAIVETGTAAPRAVQRVVGSLNWLNRLDRLLFSILDNTCKHARNSPLDKPRPLTSADETRAVYQFTVAPFLAQTGGAEGCAAIACIRRIVHLRSGRGPGKRQPERRQVGDVSSPQPVGARHGGSATSLAEGADASVAPRPLGNTSFGLQDYCAHQAFGRGPHQRPGSAYNLRGRQVVG